MLDTLAKTYEYKYVGDLPTDNNQGVEGLKCGLAKAGVIAVCLGGKNGGLSKRCWIQSVFTSLKALDKYRQFNHVVSLQDSSFRHS